VSERPNVVVNQLSGADPLVDKLAHKLFIDARFHDSDDDVKGNIRAAIVAIRARDAKLPGDFTTMLQRCDGFAGGAG